MASASPPASVRPGYLTEHSAAELHVERHAAQPRQTAAVAQRFLVLLHASERGERAGAAPRRARAPSRAPAGRFPSRCETGTRYSSVTRRRDERTADGGARGCCQTISSRRLTRCAKRRRAPRRSASSSPPRRRGRAVRQRSAGSSGPAGCCRSRPSRS